MKTLCSLPFTNLDFLPNGDVVTCCRAVGFEPLGNLKGESLDDIWNGKKLKIIREKMLRGEKLSQCEVCYQIEAAGGVSDRLTSLRNHPNAFKETAILQEIGLRISNQCNLSCRMCTPEFSTNWYKDKDLHHGSYVEPKKLMLAPDFKKFLKELEIHLPHITRIYFAGGEPLLTPEHYELLNFLIDHKRTDLSLFYNSNFTKLSYGQTHVFSLWNKFKKISLSLSLDAHGNKNDYIRHGSSYESIIENLKEFQKNIKNGESSLFPTVQALNCLSLVELIDYFLKEKLVKPRDIHFNLLSDPTFLSLQSLPQSLKVKVEEQLRNYFQNNLFLNYPPEESLYVQREFKSIIHFMNSEDHSNLFPKFINYQRSLDMRWKTQFKDVFPELDPSLVEL